MIYGVCVGRCNICWYMVSVFVYVHACVSVCVAHEGMCYMKCVWYMHGIFMVYVGRWSMCVVWVCSVWRGMVMCVCVCVCVWYVCGMCDVCAMCDV